MNDYSDLIFLIAAIAIYGLLVNNTNRSLVLNNQILKDSEIEYGAISLAQDILEEARWADYEELDEDYETYLESLYDRQLFQDNVNIVDKSSPDCPTYQPCKVIDVEIESQFLTNEDGTERTITMSLVKTQY